MRAVTNGLEALTEIQAEPPDVIVSDIAMPVLDGLELIKRIRAKEELADLPIIAMTSSYTEDFRDLAREAGVNEALNKASADQDLKQILGKITPRGKTE